MIFSRLVYSDELVPTLHYQLVLNSTLNILLLNENFVDFVASV